MSAGDTVLRHCLDVQDFPTPGVVFKDLTPLMAEPTAFAEVVEALAAVGRDADGTTVVDRVVGMEARGFVYGAPVALALGVGFVPVRKPGKLPREVISETYSLEYGEDTLQMHADALAAGSRVLVVDDVLATGGTAAATARLVRRAGAEVHGIVVVMELGFLAGREVLGDLPLTALTTV